MADRIAQESVAHGPRFFRAGWDRWTLGALAIAALVVAPLIAVALIALFPTENIWPHLVSTVLPRYLANSLGLVICVGGATAVIGTGCAWLTTMCAFPGRRWLEPLLFAPLAVPAYIGAYALVDLLEYAGPVQGALRELFGWRSARDYWFPEIRSFWAAATVLSLGYYPYVYLLARAAFREQSVSALEVSRALGQGPWGSFWRVAVPLARPAIFIGAAVAAMETLNDFGAVDFFAVQTLTTGIFSIWLEAYNAGGAAQIACVMLALILGLMLVERRSRAKRRYHNMSKRYRPVERARLGPVARWLAFLACLAPFALGFLLPVGVMLSHAMDDPAVWQRAALWRAGLNTVWLSLLTAVIAVAAGLFMVYGARNSASRLPRLLAPVTQVGYAAPGAVIAVGVLIPFAALDHRVADGIEALTGHDPGLILTGSTAAVVFAYLVRFFAVAQGAMESAMGRVTPSMDMAARSLGRTRGGALRDVHLPMIRSSILAAGMVVFVDTAKELPATLILRPFNFDTLATHTHMQAKSEQLSAAAPSALAIVALGLLPVVLLGLQKRQG
ncbi:iron ABC transporter permease [Oceanicella sp. SM1341]|uniref:ABC transporter permease n=1 Tax=Oceanicella sp. SM1341 TaxID=1548889 RepID=UPI000E4DBA1D|nr:iron ABC transporter permease [Oceanicella sp. SM1341]